MSCRECSHECRKSSLSERTLEEARKFVSDNGYL